jgi:hypothetical protein
VVSGTLSVCLYGWMDVRVASVWTVGGILFIFSTQECIRHRSNPGVHEHSSSRNVDPSEEPGNTKWSFS